MRTAHNICHDPLNSLFWEEQTARDIIFLFRVPEIIFLLAVVISMLSSLLFISVEAHALPNIIISQGGSLETLSNNTLFSYPIKLGGVECWPETLSICVAKSDTVHMCCAFLYNENTYPNEQVTGLGLYSYSFLFPISILAVRSLIWRLIDRKMSNMYKVNNFYWFYIFWDAFIGLCASAVLQQAICFFLKETVAAPRPVYYALKIWASVHSSQREHFMNTATRSFPSGHSSLSMATLGYTALILFNDAYSFLQENNPFIAKTIAYMGISIFSISIWIGSTRIVDYWHFAVDVVAGWGLGMIFAFFSYVFMTGSALDILAKLKTFKKQSLDSTATYSPLMQSQVHAPLLSVNS
eukprot:gene9107-18872_t